MKNIGITTRKQKVIYSVAGKNAECIETELGCEKKKLNKAIAHQRMHTEAEYGSIF